MSCREKIAFLCLGESLRDEVIAFSHHKSDAEAALLKIFGENGAPTGFKVSIIRMDGRKGKGPFQDFLNGPGIWDEPNSPHSPFNNGGTERFP